MDRAWACTWELQARLRAAEMWDIQRYPAHHTAIGQGANCSSQRRPPAHLGATPRAGRRRGSRAVALRHRGSPQAAHGCSNRQPASRHQPLCLAAHWSPSLWVPTCPKCSTRYRGRQVYQARRVCLMHKACSSRAGPAWPTAPRAATPRHPRLPPQSQ